MTQLFSNNFNFHDDFWENFNDGKHDILNNLYPSKIEMISSARKQIFLRHRFVKLSLGSGLSWQLIYDHTNSILSQHKLIDLQFVYYSNIISH